MEHGSHILFAPFRLDLRNQCLWRDERVIALTPKAYAVLLCLLKHHRQLVTKEELLNAVWPETYVTDAALKVCIGELRKALGDDARQPRFIETSHRRGYRFIATITEEGIERHGVPSATTSGRFSAPLRLRLSPPAGLVGREASIERLHGYLERALKGERQVVFITGEAGIGKTALVESFLLSAARDPQVWIAQGQCLEQYGAGEAYLPVLEAVTRLCQEPGRERLVELLHRHAPTWIQQMPWLTRDADREASPGVTRERMLREMAETIEALTARTPLVLALEDLHWSDYSTLDLISYLARRREPARLLVVGTYRPVEALLSEHPIENIKQELQVHNQCAEMSLEYLTEDAVREYLAARFPQLPAELAQLIHSRTGGNPLFMVNAVDYLLAEGAMVERDGRWEMKVAVEKIEVGVPESIRQMIGKQIDRLGRARQRMLEAAAVAGAEFSSAAVAAALGEEAAQIEEQCEELQRRRQFIQPLGVVEAPDGNVAARYAFIHALYQNALYDRVAPARRAQLHLKIGERGENVYGERAVEIAAELAMHFERGRDYRRAVKYLQQAADNANRRFANKEAATLARRGLELLEKLPEAKERARQELPLQMALCMALPITQGYGAAVVEQSYIRTRELCEQLGESHQLFRALRGLRNVYVFQARFKTDLEISEQLLSLARSASDNDLLVQAHASISVGLCHLGEFAAARDHYEQGLALYDLRRRRFHLSQFRHDPGVSLRCVGAWALWFLGYPDQSMEKIREAVTLAKEARHPVILCNALFYATFLYQIRREARRTLEQAETLIAQADEYGLVTWSLVGASLRGWALVELGHRSEGIAQIRQTLIAHGEVGSEVARLHFRSLLAESLMKDGQIEEGLAVLDEALAATRDAGGYFFLAEYHRLKGELLLKSEAGNAQTEAEGYFRQSIEIARQQQAKSLELRAVLSLSRLWQRQKKTEVARQTLLEIYNWFTEGFDTEDLKEAGALMEELS